VKGAGGSHEFLEHVSELRLRVRAPTLDGLLSEAGKALGELLLRGEHATAPGPPREVVVSSSDREALLVDWLNELLYLAETERWAPVHFEPIHVSDREVRARVRGVPIRETPSLVKAATHHRLRIEHENGDLQAEVILDV
jgi:SHS2 domain-containing protein